MLPTQSRDCALCPHPSLVSIVAVAQADETAGRVATLGIAATNHLVHDSIHEASKRQELTENLTTRESKVALEQEMAAHVGGFMRGLANSLVQPCLDVWSGTDGPTPDLADLFGEAWVGCSTTSTTRTDSVVCVFSIVSSKKKKKMESLALMWGKKVRMFQKKNQEVIEGFQATVSEGESAEKKPHSTDSHHQSMNIAMKLFSFEASESVRLLTLAQWTSTMQGVNVIGWVVCNCVVVWVRSALCDGRR